MGQISDNQKSGTHDNFTKAPILARLVERIDFIIFARCVASTIHLRNEQWSHHHQKLHWLWWQRAHSERYQWLSGDGYWNQ